MKRNLVIMGIISTVLSVFGCSPNGEKNDEKITQSIEEFNNRKIYTKLTEELLDKTSDDKLLQLVFDNLSQKNSEHYENEYANVMSWNKSKQAIYIIWILESEVNNGGYNQFYFNSSGQFYKYLPDALKLVGANKYSQLTKRANETFEKENPKITQHQDGTIEGFSKSYEDNPLNKFDDEFYKLYETENLQQLQVDFIRKHKTEFINN